MVSPAEPWYAVRCLFELVRPPSGDPTRTYEERTTLWRAGSFEEAIERAEGDAREYAAMLDMEYLGLAQAFHLAVEGAIGDGDEVFSLVRDRPLTPADYIDRHFDTGQERRRRLQ